MATILERPRPTNLLRNPGVGSTLGLGLYVLAGQVASNKAGPGCVISFAMAALASVFSALCYAEFAGRVPRAGSAYAYSYITVGEFVAFIIGWNLILEYVIGAASVARGFSEYLSSVFQYIILAFRGSTSDISSSMAKIAIHNPTAASSHTINQSINATTATLIASAENISSTIASNIIPQANQTMENVLSGFVERSIHESYFDSICNYVQQYFDWPSIVITIVITAFILFGVKESTNVTMTFTVVNLIVVLVVVSSSISSLDIHNWQLSKHEVPEGFGEGGFLPYGWAGVLAGSATCFFGFIGFDTIASSAEEAKNPRRNVPLSILLSLFISFLAYMSIAIVQTLLWPYYEQNKVTILPYIFDKLHMPLVHWIVLFGAIAGLASSQLGGMYPLPRILYSMAHDKLIYGYLAHVNKRLKLPVRATIVGSIFIALLSCLLNIQDLADMVSIGTLAAYSLVSLAVLILRYEDRSDAVDDSTILNNNHVTMTDILNTIESSTVAGSNINNNSFAANEKSKELERKRSKLSQKQSIPIREKGSKAVVAQLSVGFHSWFKGSAFDESQENQQEVTAQNNIQTSSPTKQNRGYLDLLINWRRDSNSGDDTKHATPNDETSRQSKVLITIIVILTIILDLNALCYTCPPWWLVSSSPNLIVEPLTILGASSCILLVFLATTMLMLSRLPTGHTNSDMFKVPLVPLIPTLSILVNTFLMLNLSYLTWVRFTVWMTIGFFIYFTYGIWNSEGYLLYLDR